MAIITRKYKAGSVVYFEGDKSEYVYILKSGSVMLHYVRPETGEEIKEYIRQGEFFGVKSALGRYPREETAQIIGDTTLLALTIADFEQLVIGNIAVVKKMLRVFSNQLRRIGRAVREVLGESNTVNPMTELFKIAEYYYKNARYNQALYVYKRYMMYAPDGKYAELAMKKIKAIESGNTMQDFAPVSADEDDHGFGSGGFASSSAPDDDFSFDMDDSPAPAASSGMDDDFSFGGDFDAPVGGVQTALASEMDSFLADDSHSGFDDFSFDEPAHPGAGSSPLQSAEDFLQQGDFGDAIPLFEELYNTSSDPEVKAKAGYELGLAYKGAGRGRDALTVFSSVIKENPASDHAAGAMYEIGQHLENSGARDKAVPYYRKAASMKQAGEPAAMAAKALARLGG